jgi:hypothetical protein
MPTWYQCSFKAFNAAISFKTFTHCQMEGVYFKRHEDHIKSALNILGALLVLFGVIWFLQGINVLPGSFMTGQIRWAIYGGIAVAAGIALMLVARRRRP